MLPAAVSMKPAVDLLEGMKVLARREKDGYYCPGTIKEKVNIMKIRQNFYFFYEVTEIKMGTHKKLVMSCIALFTLDILLTLKHRDSFGKEK